MMFYLFDRKGLSWGFDHYNLLETLNLCRICLTNVATQYSLATNCNTIMFSISCSIVIVKLRYIVLQFSESPCIVYQVHKLFFMQPFVILCVIKFKLLINTIFKINSFRFRIYNKLRLQIVK